MEEIIKEFRFAYVRDYKGGKEIRVKDLEFSVQKAQNIIKRKNLNVEVFERDPILNSFSIREI